MQQNLTLKGENLKKVYKKRTVVNKVSVQVQQGEVVGLLGPNGAGKTTTFYMIVGMIKPNDGKELLDELGLVNVRKTLGFQLSGGERRRCEIARALATDPKFILLDEPFAGVDPIAVEDIMTIVANLKHKGIGILITDHNVHETLSIVDRAYILINGQIFKEGTANQLAEDQDVRKLYLGEKFKLDRYS